MLDYEGFFILICIILFDYNITTTTEERVENVQSCHNIFSVCPEPEKLVVKGDVVKLSCLLKCCGKLSVQCENATIIKKVNIFALDSIIIDEDFKSEGHTLTLSIIAPIWNIIGVRYINLEGRHGRDYPDRARDAYDGTNGENGKSGEQGGPGGNFMGIGMEFINGESLTIVSNGGDGGSGQDGGNGKNGTQGIYAKKYYGFINSTSCKINICIDNQIKLLSANGQKNKFYCKLTKEYKPTVKIWDTANILRNFERVQEYFIEGKEGQKAGNGGNGGRRGYPGLPGDIILVQTNKLADSKIFKYNKTGMHGFRDGKGGSGGKGPMNGLNLLIKRYCTSPVLSSAVVDNMNKHKIEMEYNGSIYFSNDGKKGLDGAVYNTTKSYRPLLERSTTSKVLTEYKEYLEANLNKDIRKTFTKSMLQSEDVCSLYDTVTFVDVLLSLEEMFHNRNGNRDDLTLFYKTLLACSVKYAETDYVQNSSQDKKVLSYLYTAVIGRINNLRNQSEHNLIIEIEDYLELIRKSIEHIQKKQVPFKDLWIVNHYRDMCVSNVINKITENEQYLKNEVLPKQERKIREIDNQISQLLTEIKILNKEKAQNENEIDQAMDSLKDDILLKGALGVFEFVVEGLNLIGKVAKVVITVLQGTKAVGPLAINKPTTLQLTECHRLVENISDWLEYITHQEAEKIKWKFDEVYDVASVITPENKEIFNVINDIKKYLPKIETIMDVTNLGDKLHAVLLKIENELANNINAQSLLQRLKYTSFNAKQNEKNTENKGSKKRVREIMEPALMSKIKAFASLPFSLACILSAKKYDHNERSIFVNALVQVKDSFKTIRQYEEKIKVLFFTLVSLMKTNIEIIDSYDKTKVRTALDISKWRVYYILEEVEYETNLLAESLKSKDRIYQYVRNINKGYILLTEIYRRFEDYQELHQWDNHLVDISLTAAEAISITNKTLKTAMESLDIIVRSTLVLHLYNVAFISFQHHVFPFADLYIDNIIAPLYLKYENSIQYFVSKSNTQLKLVQVKLALFYDESSEIFRYSRRKSFHIHSSFYKWTNNQFKDELYRLLSGESVILYADIIRSGISAHSIKFKQIQIYLESTISSRQYFLDKALEGVSINATHMGYSYYQYDGQIYLISTKSLSITHSFILDQHNNPLIKGGAYNIIQKKEFLLSPYSLWEMKLFNNSCCNFTFGNLKVFKDEVNILLGGFGVYLKRDIVKAKDLKVQHYYKPALYHMT